MRDAADTCAPMGQYKLRIGAQLKFKTGRTALEARSPFHYLLDAHSGSTVEDFFFPAVLQRICFRCKLLRTTVHTERQLSHRCFRPCATCKAHGILNGVLLR